MSDFDLVPSEGGDLAPLAPSAPLSPSSDSGWLILEPDFLSVNQPYSGSSAEVFGQPLPGDVSPAQIQQMLGEITSLYTSDAAKMGIDPSFARAAANWYKQAAAAPVPHEYANHPYNLRGFSFPRNDQPFVTAFCNFAAQMGASERDVRNSLWWAGELARRASQQQPQPQRQQASTIYDLSDAEFKQVEARAARDLENAEAILRQKWGSQFEQKMAAVRNHVRSLPAVQRDFLESAVCQGGLLLANAPETVERLYAEAIHKTINPNNLGAEIAQIEQIIRTDRKRYNNDIVLQERLRALYQMRDG